jgi:sulfate permease, SulP family
LVTAWNMSEARHLPERVLRAPKSDASVLVICLVLTVLFDMVVAVVVGIVLAALLFMRRMAEVSGVELVPQGERRERLQLPDHVLLFELAGPLFFGAVSKAIAALERVPNDVRIVLLDLRSVPALDGTAIHQLDAAVSRLSQRGVVLILGGLQVQPVRALARAGWRDEPGRVHLRPAFEGAVELARELAA